MTSPGYAPTVPVRSWYLPSRSGSPRWQPSHWLIGAAVEDRSPDPDSCRVCAADSSASAERGLNFLELKRIFRRDGFLSLVVLPMCLIYPSIGYRISSTGAWHLRNSTDPFRTINGYRSRTPLRLQLNDSQLTAFDFTVRLNSTVLPRWVNIAPGIWRMQRWDNINNGKVLQCLVSAGLLYARAALACLRCQLELPAVPGPESSENETHDGSTMVGAEASHVLGEAKRRNSEWEWEGVPVLHRPRPSFTMVVDNN